MPVAAALQTDPAVDPNLSVSYAVSISPSTTVIVDSDSTSYSYLSSPAAMSPLPASIVPSDVLSSFIGSTLPSTLVTDTDLPAAPFTTEWVMTSTSTPPTPTTTQAAEFTATSTIHVSVSTMTTVPLGSPTPTDSVVIGAGKIQSNASPRCRWGKISVGILGLWGLCLVAGIAAQM